MISSTSMIRQQQAHSRSNSNAQILQSLRDLMPFDHSSVSSSQSKEALLKIADQMRMIITLQHQLTHFRSQFFKQTSQYNRLSQENRQFQEKIKHLNFKNADMQKQIQAKKHRINQLQERLNEKDKEIQRLKQQHNKEKVVSSNEVNRIKMENDIIRRQRDQMSLQIQDILIKQQQSMQKQHGMKEMISERAITMLPSKETQLQLARQDQLIHELMLRNDNLRQINSLLEKELRVAELKLIEVQQKMDDHFCSIYLQKTMAMALKDNHEYSNVDYHSAFETKETKDSCRLSKKQTQNGKESLREQNYFKRQEAKMTPLYGPKPQRKSYRTISYKQRGRLSVQEDR